jgi:protoheme IX farnesyltransferase
MQTTLPDWQKTAAVDLVPALQPTISTWKLIVTLFKLRIVTLLLMAAFGGAALGITVTGHASIWSLLLLAVSGTLSAGGASGINQYLERERDARMTRTARRPLATGYLAHPKRVLWIGLGMIATAVGLAALFNLALALWVLLGAVIYVAVYTIWLKPRTVWNIVIGGAAGSCAVISGGAAVGAWSAPTVWLLALLLFFWTPVHFWSLALAYRDDYARGDYPMLPTQVSASAAAYWTGLHTYLTIGAAVVVGVWPQINWLYLIPMGLAGLLFIQRTHKLFQQPTKGPALALFHFSNIYLSLALLMVIVSAIWR